MLGIMARTRRTRGFTLVELLVVVGIVALLISLLLPVINKARESARRAVCLSRISELTRATLLYAGDNNQWLPDAAMTNSTDSPLSPRSTGSPARTLIGPNVWVQPSIGDVLAPYLGKDPLKWQCPSAPDGTFSWSGPDPLAGTSGNNEFKPNYAYLSTKDLYFKILGSDPADISRFRMQDWAARNVSGLKIPRVRPYPMQSASEITLFYDRSPAYHSVKRPDIYSGQVADYWASYGYLDGHAEGKGYRDLDQYIHVFHNPIEQNWFSVNFAAKFQGAYLDADDY